MVKTRVEQFLYSKYDLYKVQFLSLRLVSGSSSLWHHMLQVSTAYLNPKCIGSWHIVLPENDPLVLKRVGATSLILMYI